MNIMIVDTETTGLSHDDDHLVEVAAAVWSTEHRTLLDAWSWLVRPYQATEEGLKKSVEVHGIPAGAVQMYGHSQHYVGEELDTAIERLDVKYILAHNADFDRPWIEAITTDRTTRWLCTATDFRWPKGGTKRRPLAVLALDHGVGVTRAHRALDDVLTLCAVIEAAARMEPLEGLFAYATAPKAIYRAIVSIEHRDRAKAQGFRWCPEKKMWWRELREEDLVGSDEWGFRLMKVNDDDRREP